MRDGALNTAWYQILNSTHLRLNHLCRWNGLGRFLLVYSPKALENLATLRADNGGTMSRLQYASDNATLQAKNFAAANGRIVDVDIAAESTNLAKYQILSQASASMIAQANSSMDIALMLLR